MSDVLAMEKKWCKIVEIDGEQVLFYMEPDSSNDNVDCESLHQIVRVQGVCADIKIGGIPIADCEKVYDSINEAQAKLVLKTIDDLLKEQDDTRPN